MADPFFESRPEHMPLGKLVSWVGGAMQTYYRRTVSRHGVTGTAVSVLGALAHAEGLSQRELAGRVGLTPATLTPVLDALEQDGRIGRERDTTDRRIVRLSITDEGRAHVRSVFTEVAASFRAQMPQPSPEHEQVIRDYLVAVLAAVSQDPGSGPGRHVLGGSDAGKGAE
ncbi:MarR family winged helix-turn-helix transcriptional regulator [Pseudonocardia sp. KRD291]|uniref:MarR family winged helix-turn-helix transcriptional regulator n=1 Tax=Pseudonocardia sp. KRD291 TaxID=2792007 RepID=UPI001C49F4C4|nr:MarR family transcriptional regulator [Pseudonocardia sp. KRD291]MBW0106959.1 MarR family transcriptional regulator [Pseudonocardia sp. KRD291]